MAKPERRKLERVQYWQGQMLRAQDFLNLQGVEAQRRWWHNRAIHNTYGVAEGLMATLVPAAVPTGVCVSPGVAYDAFGRELILERSQTIPLPSNVPTGMIGAMSLLIRYMPPSRRMHPDEISEVCWTAPGSVVAGTAEFVWKLGDNLNPAEGVSVYAVYYSPAPTLKGSDPYYVRISAEPLARPLLVSGATVPGNTPWQFWSAPPSPNDPSPLIGVQTWVDTTTAGFTDVPCYFAWIEGPLFNAQSLWLLPALLPNIADASITGFTFRMWLPPPPVTYGFAFHARRELLANLNLNLVPASLFNLFAQQQNLYISWIGCQMQGKACSCSQATAAASQSSASTQET
jgi:hypothetical protein